MFSVGIKIRANQTASKYFWQLSNCKRFITSKKRTVSHWWHIKYMYIFVCVSVLYMCIQYIMSSSIDKNMPHHYWLSFPSNKRYTIISSFQHWSSNYVIVVPYNVFMDNHVLSVFLEFHLHFMLIPLASESFLKSFLANHSKFYGLLFRNILQKLRPFFFYLFIPHHCHSYPSWRTISQHLWSINFFS